MRRAGAFVALMCRGGLRGRHAPCGTASHASCCSHAVLLQALCVATRCVHTTETANAGSTAQSRSTDNTTTSSSGGSSSSNSCDAPQTAGKTRFARSTLPAAVSAQGEQAAAPAKLTARQFCLLMFNISNEQRRMPTLAQRRTALQRLSRVALPHVVGLGGRDVVQCVRTLAMLRASPSLDMVHDAARWLAVHGASLNSESLVQALYALLQLRYATLSGVVASVHDCLLRDLEETNWPIWYMALGVVLHCLPDVRQDSPLWATATRLRAALQRRDALVLAAPPLRRLCPEMVVLLAGLSVAAKALRTHAACAMQDAGNSDGGDEEDMRAWRTLAQQAWSTVTGNTKDCNTNCSSGGGTESSAASHTLAADGSGAQRATTCEDVRALDKLSVEDVLTLARLSCGGAQACGGWLTACDDDQAGQRAAPDAVRADDKEERTRTSVEAIRACVCDALAARVRAVMATQSVLPPDWHVALAEACLCGETAKRLRPLWAETVEPAVRARLQPREETESSSSSSNNNNNGGASVPVVGIATGLLQLYVKLHRTSTAKEEQQEEKAGARDMRPLQLASFVPDYVIACLCAAIARSERTGEADVWEAATVDCVLYYFSRDAALRAYAVRLTSLYITSLQRRARPMWRHSNKKHTVGDDEDEEHKAGEAAGKAVQPEDILPLLHPELVTGAQSLMTQAAVMQLAQLVAGGIERWSVTQVLHFLEQLCAMPADESSTVANVLRSAALTLSKYVGQASGAQLTALLRCYGMTGVREDRFCLAVAERVHALLPELTAPDVSVILGGLTALEYADVRPFLDAAPLVLGELAVMTTVDDVVRLLGAYAMQRVHNFRLYIALADRLVALAPSVSLMQLVSSEVSLLRMELTHAALTSCLVRRVREVLSRQTGDEAEHQADALTPHTALQVLHVLSRLVYRAAAVRDDTGAQGEDEKGGEEAELSGAAGHEVAEMRALCQALAEYIVHAHEGATGDEFALEEVVEVMLSLARVHREAQGSLFDRLALRVMGAVPTASPPVMLDLVEAYALAGRQGGSDTSELFTTIARRLIAEKADVPATHIAAMLAAFARLGIRQDHLFVEMIPRVRLVAVYGGAQDVTNVVTAYAAANVWHYQLFAKLAERAVQLRVAFTPPLLVRLLEAYAAVGMRQTRLLHEFGANELVHFLPGLTPAVVLGVVECYAKLDAKETALLQAVAEYAARRLQRFKPDEAARLLTAMQQLGFVAPADLRAAYARCQPHIYEDIVGVAAALDKDVAASETPALPVVGDAKAEGHTGA